MYTLQIYLYDKHGKPEKKPAFEIESSSDSIFNKFAEAVLQTTKNLDDYIYFMPVIFKRVEFYRAILKED